MLCAVLSYVAFGEEGDAAMPRQKTHFIGIGGAGMSGLAHVMLHGGAAVSGSDLAESATTARLEAMGASVYIGHDAAHIEREAPNVVVISSAVPADNPELQYARSRGIPVISRAEMLARLMENKQGIAVAGTHGKTTVTSMIALVLERGGLDPTIVIGGELNDIGSNAKVGQGPHFVAEADESDRSFLYLKPSIAVVTNVEADHLENYSGIDDIRSAFATFLSKLPEDGLAVVCGDDANAMRVTPEHCRVITYGLKGDYDYVADNVQLLPMGSRVVVKERGVALGMLSLQVPGEHNIANALAAVAIGRSLGLSFARVAEALSSFRGAKRRFDVLGEERDILVIDDYAHHPTEIRATLSAVHNMGRRVIAIFQPHRYSRTKHLLDELATSFGHADHVVLTDIYSALEPPIPGITVEVLADRIRAVEGDKVTVVRDVAAVPGYLAAMTRPGDVVITLGAGNIRQASEGFLSVLGTEPALVAHLTPPRTADAASGRDWED